MVGDMNEQQQLWWVRPQVTTVAPQPSVKAVAYYRHSAQDRQENSVAIQQEQVRQWARENNVEIIHEFADRGKSGLTAEGRHDFTHMMEHWVKRRPDFSLILCLDVSRWGRFQDIDLSATYSAECKRHGKQVIYTTLGKPKDNDQLYQVHVQFERYRAAQYSKELSDKVHRGCIKIAQQGFWAGGKPPYGLQRLLLNEQRQPLHVLEAGQRKSIQNQRVTLAAGDEREVATIRRIFAEFVHDAHTTVEIAARLNREAVMSPGGGLWDGSKIRRILFNELYLGTIVYNKTTQKLKTRSKRNPMSDWIKTAHAFSSLIEPSLFNDAQHILSRAALRYTPEFMLEQIRRLFKEHGSVWPSLIHADPMTPAPGTYAQRFSSLDAAYQQAFKAEVDQVRLRVESLLRGIVGRIEAYDDFLVINRQFTILVQPSIPIPHGYDHYWYFYPDARGVVDITLGVPISDHTDLQILGYVVLPRLLVKHRGLRVFGSSETSIELYGYTGLDFIGQLVRS